MSASKKRDVIITQFNTPSARNLMPLSAGLLYSYAISQPKLNENYHFQIEIMRESPEESIQRYKDPAVLGYSVYFWNFNQSVLTAAAAKKKFPKALVVFGGPSAPLHEHDTIQFFKEHPYVDAVVAGEGEFVFADLLSAMIDTDKSQDETLQSVEGISYRRSNGEAVFRAKRDYIKDVSVLPSPFLNGVFDDLLGRFKQHMTGVVWETNRGCPFTCSFCFWGGPDSKISQFSMERVYAELDWIAKNKISYIFGADANFGILKRDIEIARYMADLNRKTGYPKFFVINWTKNSTEKIFEIVDVLKEADIKFMMTTSVQSHNPDTLKAIKRSNIKLESFNKILEEANKRNFNTYSELILGLPLETYDTFVDGIRKVLSPQLNYHFNVYQCVLIPGTEMSEPEFIAKYDIKTRRCIMNLGKTVHEGDAIPEYENIVVATSTTPIEKWKQSHSFAYLAKAIYGFRPGFFLLNHLKNWHGVDIVSFIEHAISLAKNNPAYPTLSHALSLLDSLQESILSGEGNETIKMPNVSASLHPETAAFVALLSDQDSFYKEMHKVTESYLAAQGKSLKDDPYYEEIVAYQCAMLPTWRRTNKQVLHFKNDIHQYFKDIAVAGDAKVTPSNKPSILSFGEGESFENIDVFLQKQIYGGMVFTLSSVTPLTSGAGALKVGA